MHHQQTSRLETHEINEKQLITTIEDCRQLVIKILQALMMGTDETQLMISYVMQLHSEIEKLEYQITGRGLAEQTLIESNEALHRFSRKTLEVLENDRQKMAKQLHDVIGAGLSAIKFMLEEKQYRIDKKNIDSDFNLKPVILHLTDMIKGAKTFSSDLRPSTLDDLGLLATLSSYCRKFGGYHQGIAIDCKADVSEDQIPENYKIHIYRIVQEIMMNAANSGHPTLIRSKIDIEENHLRLTVQDDGDGIDPSSSSEHMDSSRLQCMREHAEICGGTLSVDHQPGMGTRIKVRLPLQ